MDRGERRARGNAEEKTRLEGTPVGIDLSDEGEGKRRREEESSSWLTDEARTSLVNALEDVKEERGGRGREGKEHTSSTLIRAFAELSTKGQLNDLASSCPS